MRLMNILKSIGGFLLAIAGIVGLTLAAFLLVTGGAWLADKAYPWILVLFALALGISIFILLPLAIFHKTRGFAGIGIHIASYIFGLTLVGWLRRSHWRPDGWRRPPHDHCISH